MVAVVAGGEGVQVGFFWCLERIRAIINRWRGLGRHLAGVLSWCRMSMFLASHRHHQIQISSQPHHLHLSLAAKINTLHFGLPSGS